MVEKKKKKKKRPNRKLIPKEEAARKQRRSKQSGDLEQAGDPSGSRLESTFSDCLRVQCHIFRLFVTQ